MKKKTSLLPWPEPTATQAHPMPSYLLRVRLTHAEAEAVKQAVARRCLMGTWTPDTDDADWLLQTCIQQIMDQQGMTHES
jgi:hypothetical protein